MILNIALITAGVLLVLAFILYIFATHAFKIKRVPHDITPAEFDIPFEEVRFPTRLEKQLYGWWVPAKEGPENAKGTLILVHGWKRNVGRMLTYIRHLYPSNFNMLAFDARQHGSSDPDRMSSMPIFAQDIEAAVNYLKTRFADEDDFALIGLSLGGAASILASNQTAGIKLVVAVGAPAHAGDIIRFEMQKRGVPYFPLTWFLLRFFEYKLQRTMDDFAPENNINPRVRYLFIQGEDDDVVPVEHATRLYKSVGPELGALWLLPERSHSNCHRAEGFWPRLDEYLHKQFSHSRE